MFKKIDDGCWINIDNIVKFSVVPECADIGIFLYVINYWDIAGNESKINRYFETKDKANEMLNRFMAIICAEK